MTTPGLRAPPRTVLVILGLVLIAALVQGWTTLLPGAAVLFIGASRLRGPVRSLMNASRPSWKSTVALIVTFALALVGAGHGVAPLGMFLVYGWEHFLVPVVLAWLAILLLGSSALLRAAIAPALSLVGVVLIVSAWALIQVGSDAPLAGAMGSLPFLACLVVHVIHLWRIRFPARPPSS